MVTPKYSTVFLLVNIFIFVHSHSNQLKWESASTISSDQLDPAGKEGEFTYYVARGSVRKNWLNGKSLVMNGEHVAYTPYAGQEAEATDFQVLVVPAGTTSWVASGGNNLPNYWIAGGYHPAVNETTVICRAFHAGHLIVGNGLKSYGACYTEYLNKVHPYSSYEILVLNDYGIATGAAKVPRVPGPIFVSSSTTKTAPMYFRWPKVLLD
ncbi:unnamed protein product [Orchesella dallaii]|uniref:Uncharacterized protein n=1 Tax=Orchesella dallaii TaxID=48710 RepID=A0ABP1PIK7_9HEXA